MSPARVWKVAWKWGEGDGSSDGLLIKGWKKNHTFSIMETFRQNINSDFYIKYSYAYVIVNNGTGLKMVYSEQQRGSPRIDPL